MFWSQESVRVISSRRRTWIESLHVLKNEREANVVDLNMDLQPDLHGVHELRRRRMPWPGRRCWWLISWFAFIFWRTRYENYEVFVDAFLEKPEGRMSRIPTRRPKLQMTYPTWPKYLLLKRRSWILEHENPKTDLQKAERSQTTWTRMISFWLTISEPQKRSLSRHPSHNILPLQFNLNCCRP